MAWNRRELLRTLGGTVSALAMSRLIKAQTAGQSTAFMGSRHSLEGYRIPDWFRDAKFGIWSHWGPQSAIERGDWYARNMYMQGSDQYLYHVETYGHPSKVGYRSEESRVGKECRSRWWAY